MSEWNRKHWRAYEILKLFANNVNEITKTDKPIWEQHENITKEAEKAVDELFK